MNENGYGGFQDGADLDAVRQQAQTPLYRHVAKTYGWMFLGLLLTFVTSFLLYATRMVLLFFITPWLPFALLIGKLALVFYLTSRIRKYSVTTARVIFLCYSVLTGIALSPLLLLYDAGSAIFVFGVVSVFFGVMAAAGLITKRDVSGFAPLILFGLLALLLMGAVNLFLGLEGFETAICFIGVAIFLGVTTYDSKKVKDYYHAFEGDAEMLEKVSIYSALNLYLDFINLFLYLLRLLGKRK